MGAIKNFFHVAFTYAKPKELFFRFIELIIGYPIYGISFLWPRNKNIWVFGTNVGFTDNAKYLYIYALEQREIEVYWISTKQNVVLQMREQGLPAYSRWSFKGIWICLRAYIYIYTSHTQCINFFTSGGVKKVNLWHGVGIKSGNAGSDNKNESAYKSILMRIVSPHNYERNTLFLSTSPLMNKHFTDMFALEDGVLYEGMYPRCSYLMSSREIIEQEIQKYERPDVRAMVNRFKTYKKVFLYMPTWRGNMKDDFISDAGFDFRLLNDRMKELNALFVFKLHPAVRFGQLDLKDMDNICFLDKNMDVYPLLPFTDMLITDYSSIYYDYILMDDKGVLLFPFDIEEYKKSSNRLAFDYDEYTPGPRVYTFEDMIEYLMKGDYRYDSAERKKILRLFWGNNYNEKSIGQLYERIKMI